MPFPLRKELLLFFLEQGYAYGCTQWLPERVTGLETLSPESREVFDAPPAEGNELLFECPDIFWVDTSLVEEHTVPVRKGSTRRARRLFLKVP